MPVNIKGWMFNVEVRKAKTYRIRIPTNLYMDLLIFPKSVDHNIDRVRKVSCGMHCSRM